MTESSAPEKCTPASEMTDDEFAAEFRTWLDANLVGEFAEIKGVGGPGSEHEFFPQRLAWERHMAAAGWTCVGWPVEHGGRGASLSQQVRFHEEYAKADAPARVSHLGETLLGPTLIAHGTREQKDRFLPRIIDVTELWAQGYSEPGAGSDLANIATKARRDGDEWVLTGQKVWTSGAQFADWGQAIVRTEPGTSGRHGLTTFLVPMNTPGLEIRQIRQMSGGTSFNEVFLTEARVPDSHRLGEIGDGWAVTRATLGFERANASNKAGVGGSFEQLVDLARRTGSLQHRDVRLQLAEIRLREVAADVALHREKRAAAAGSPPGAAGSMRKLQWVTRLGLVSELARTLLGDRLVANTGEPGTFSWNTHVLGAPGYRIAGGTDQIQRNIVAERHLGLPPEVKPFAKNNREGRT